MATVYTKSAEIPMSFRGIIVFYMTAGTADLEIEHKPGVWVLVNSYSASDVTEIAGLNRKYRVALTGDAEFSISYTAP